MSIYVDDDILGESETEIYLPYDEHTEKHVPWSKYRMEIIKEFGMSEENHSRLLNDQSD